MTVTFYDDIIVPNIDCTNTSVFNDTVLKITAQPSDDSNEANMKFSW
jgi:hypothetical protein